MKKLLHNIYNFFYVTFNWSLPLAIFITWHEIKRGPKYKINTVKPESLNDLTIADGDISKSSPYEALNYFILENLLQAFCKLFPNEKRLIDVGSGKGRVMVVAAHFGFSQIIGIDFAKELCETAQINVDKIKARFPNTFFKIYCNDILNYSIMPADKVFFLFNPFNKEMMEKFSENIDLSIKDYPRTIYCVYANPLQKQSLLERGYREVYTITRMRLLSGSILVKSIS